MLIEESVDMDNIIMKIIISSTMILHTTPTISAPRCEVLILMTATPGSGITHVCWIEIIFSNINERAAGG